MTEGIKTIIYPVTDLAKAKTLYGHLLGVEPDMDEAYYVGFNVEGQDVGLDPHGQRMTEPVGYWEVDDIKKSLELLLDAGAEAHQAVRGFLRQLWPPPTEGAGGPLSGAVVLPLVRSEA